MKLLHYPKPNRWHIQAVALLNRAAEELHEIYWLPDVYAARHILARARVVRLVAEMRGWRLP